MLAAPEKNRHRKSSRAGYALEAEATCASAAAIWLAGVRKRTAIERVTAQPTKTNHGQEIFGHQSGMNHPKFHCDATSFPRRSARTSKAGIVTLHNTSTDIIPTVIPTTLAPSEPRRRVSIPRRKTPTNAP